MVVACPGSGKTRVLTHRVMRGLVELPSRQHRVAALTYTNRAADEIMVRLDEAGVDQSQLWAGTIHSFSLEWVLRPYAPYMERTRLGFSVADEYFTEKLLRSLIGAAGQKAYFKVNTKRDRDGSIENTSAIADRIAAQYHERLVHGRLLDYDEVLFCAHSLLCENPEVAATLAQIMHLICVDEVQDTQDLQFGILERIARAEAPCPTFFFVGDPDQSIYDSLGAVSKTAAQISSEFGIAPIASLGLTGNYRSSQRIIDYYRSFRPGVEAIEALSANAGEHGSITFSNQELHKDDISSHIATLIKGALEQGTPEREICVLVPQWWLVRSLARELAHMLPEVSFDAPGLSPLHAQRDNIWFKIARIFLTTPEPRLYRTRLRWAGEVLRGIEEATRAPIELGRYRARAFLRLTNSIEIEETDGLVYLRRAFASLMELLAIGIELFPELAEAHDVFFEKAEARFADFGDEAPSDVDYLRKVFKYPSGVVVSTCHGVKGEEYDTVICFGLLTGYIPHWDHIIDGDPVEAQVRAGKLLYVVCSRARLNLHLIAEFGRTTKASGRALETTQHLAELDYAYDKIA